MTRRHSGPSPPLDVRSATKSPWWSVIPSMPMDLSELTVKSIVATT